MLTERGTPRHVPPLAGVSSPSPNPFGQRRARQRDPQERSGSRGEVFNTYLKERVGAKGGRNELRVWEQERNRTFVPPNALSPALRWSGLVKNFLVLFTFVTGSF